MVRVICYLLGVPGVLMCAKLAVIKFGQSTREYVLLHDEAQ
jgi:hypothetical protein